MLFLREIAAFLQLTIMPGAVVLGVLRPGFGKVRSLLLIPGISLPVNYIFTASALAAGGFRPALVVAYTAAVWLAAIWLWRKELYHFLFTPPETKRSNPTARKQRWRQRPAIRRGRHMKNGRGQTDSSPIKEAVSNA